MFGCWENWTFGVLQLWVFIFWVYKETKKKKESYVCKSSCFSMWSCWEDWNVEYGLIVWIVWTACNWSYVVIWLWTLYCLMSLFFSLLFFFKMIFFYFSIGFWWCSFAFLFGPKLSFLFFISLSVSLFLA